MRERWKDVVGFEGYYEASTLGRVRSVARVAIRKNGAPHTIRSKVLRANLVAGYPALCLQVGAQRKTCYVHKLVAAAFMGSTPEGQEIRHDDGDVWNSSVANLLFGTSTQNMRDKNKHGRSIIGHRTHTAKLSVVHVAFIRFAHARGTRFRDLKRMFPISEQQLTSVLKRKYWDPAKWQRDLDALRENGLGKSQAYRDRSLEALVLAVGEMRT